MVNKRSNISISEVHFYFKPHYNWASLIAQLVKNPPAMQETPGQFLGQENLLQKG